MPVGALHPLFGVDVHHMDRLAGIEAGRHELDFDAGLAGIGAGEAEVALLRVAVMSAALEPFPGNLGVDDMRGIGTRGRHVSGGVDHTGMEEIRIVKEDVNTYKSRGYR